MYFQCLLPWLLCTAHSLLAIIFNIQHTLRIYTCAYAHALCMCVTVNGCGRTRRTSLRIMYRSTRFVRRQVCCRLLVCNNIYCSRVSERASNYNTLINPPPLLIVANEGRWEPLSECSQSLELVQYGKCLLPENRNACLTSLMRILSWRKHWSKI